jgi:hypothetical protein
MQDRSELNEVREIVVEAKDEAAKPVPNKLKLRSILAGVSCSISSEITRCRLPDEDLQLPEVRRGGPSPMRLAEATAIELSAPSFNARSRARLMNFSSAVIAGSVRFHQSPMTAA